jgi:hypothetical protein
MTSQRTQHVSIIRTVRLMLATEHTNMLCGQHAVDVTVYVGNQTHSGQLQNVRLSHTALCDAGWRPSLQHQQCERSYCRP